MVLLQSRWRWAGLVALTVVCWVFVYWHVRSWPTWRRFWALATASRAAADRGGPAPGSPRGPRAVGATTTAPQWQLWGQHWERQRRWPEARAAYLLAATRGVPGAWLDLVTLALHQGWVAEAAQWLREYEARVPAMRRDPVRWDDLRVLTRNAAGAGAGGDTGAATGTPAQAPRPGGGVRWDLWLSPVAAPPPPAVRPPAAGTGPDVDAQNVHDHGVVQSLVPVARSLAGTAVPPAPGPAGGATAPGPAGGTTTETGPAGGASGWETHLQQWLVTDVEGLPVPAATQSRARRVLQAMRQHNTWMMAYEAHEWTLLERVVQRILHETDVPRQRLWRQVLVEQLADAVEPAGPDRTPGWQVVCASGRVARVLQTLAVDNGETIPVLTDTLWRQELLQAASRRRSAFLATLSPEGRALVESGRDLDLELEVERGPEAEARHFYQTWPQVLQDFLHVEFVATGRLTATFVKAELDSWLAQGI